MKLRTDAILNYFRELPAGIGSAWNRFWFTPREPVVLSLMRIMVGLMALYTLATFTPDLVRLFGYRGLLPIDTVLELQGGDTAARSYLELFETTTSLYVVHLISMLVVLAFTVGFYSRVSGVLTLVVMLSYFHRGPMLMTLSEPIMSFVLFYLCFAPTGAAFSVDRLLAQRNAENGKTLKPTATVSANVATRLLQVHLVLVYAMMAIAKLHDGVPSEQSETGVYNAWWLGEAVWWLAARPESRLIDVTGFLAEHPYFRDAWTHAILLFEICFALFIFHAKARPILLTLAVPMWLSLALITGLTPFAVMMLIANMAFVSPCFIREIGLIEDRSTPSIEANAA